MRFRSTQKLNDKIITFWQFYVAGAASIVGWVFSRDNAWSKQKRVGVGISALIFIVFSLTALYKTICNLNRIVEYLKYNTVEFLINIDEQVLKIALDRLDQGSLIFNLGPHLFVDGFILYFIFIVSKHEPSANN